MMFCDFGKVHHGEFPSSKHIAMLRREDLVDLVWSSHFWWEQEECPQMLYGPESLSALTAKLVLRV